MKRAARTVFAAGFTCLVGLVACSAPAVTAAATPAPDPVPEPTTAPADASIDAAPILDPAPLPSPEDLAGSEPAPPASAHGSVSGTAFWLGPSPDYQEDRPLHFGSAHPRDWQGADEAEYWGLEGVFVSATPLDPNAPGGRVPDALDWPDRDSFICYRTKDCAPHLNVVRGDHFTISNHRTQALSLQFVAGDRVRMSVPVAVTGQVGIVGSCGKGRALLMMRAVRSSGPSAGFAVSISAATPAACGAAVLSSGCAVVWTGHVTVRSSGFGADAPVPAHPTLRRHVTGPHRSCDLRTRAAHDVATHGVPGHRPGRCKRYNLQRGSDRLSHSTTTR